jgi:hypothetical protein
VPLYKPLYNIARITEVRSNGNPLTKPLLKRSNDMANPTITLTQARLKELLHYDPDTGVFTWQIDRGRLAKAGCRAGYYADKGYRKITVGSKSFAEHRLAWFMTCGAWPVGVIDHINGIVDDNRISNLRDVSRSANSQNQRRGKKHSTTGFLGVCAGKGKFQGAITLPCGKRLHLGTYDSPEEAHEAYLAAKRIHHAGCTI